jgi:hypothetical protein
MSVSPVYLVEQEQNEILENESIRDIIHEMKKGNTSFEKLSYIKSSDINRIIESVKGLKHNSASKTETWIVNFNDEVARELKVSSAFMKISIDNSSYFEYENNEIFTYLGTYKTENTIYLYINSLSEMKICNNFIRLLTVKNDVSLKDMTSIISEKMVNGNFLYKPIAINNFKRNIIDTLKDNSTRSEIGVSRNRECDINLRRNWTYQYVMTEALSNKNYVFSAYMDSLYSNKIPFTINTWNVIFQVSHACFIMEKFRISHNDLHTGNIYLKLQEKQEEFTYIVEDKIFTFTPKYIALIYDYDRSYAEINGIKINNTVTYKEFAQTNEVIPGRDFIRFIYIVYRYHTHDIDNKRTILKCISKDSESRLRIINYFQKNTIDYSILDEKFLRENILPIKNIMINLSIVCSMNDTITTVKENIYTCK